MYENNIIYIYLLILTVNVWKGSNKYAHPNIFITFIHNTYKYYVIIVLPR